MYIKTYTYCHFLIHNCNSKNNNVRNMTARFINNSSKIEFTTFGII